MNLLSINRCSPNDAWHCATNDAIKATLIELNKGKVTFVVENDNYEHVEMSTDELLAYLQEEGQAKVFEHAMCERGDDYVEIELVVK